MTSATKFPAIARFKTPSEFAAHLAAMSAETGETVPCDLEIAKAPLSPLARPLMQGGRVIGNRWCIHPMEGWDGMRGGTPSEWTLRRWRNFGLSGAKLIWGGEAVAVEAAGRANPNQLYHRPENERGLAELREILVAAHREAFDRTDDLLVGLQLTHSGRYCRPEEHSRLEPRTAQIHPALDKRFGVDPAKALLTDTELDDLVGRFVAVSKSASELGYDFVDVKHCHGYLLHELLGAKRREGRYGGSFENRTRFLREVVKGIRREAPGLMIGVRLSAYDLHPSPAPANAHEHHFGMSVGNPSRWDPEEPAEFLRLCAMLGIFMVNVTAGSPYYSPHIQRPAMYPPVDSTEPRHDPLTGVIRQLQAVRELKRMVPEMPLVGTAYTYLQEYLPHVAQALVREGWTDMVGLGRMVLSHPTLPAETLARGELTRGRICRTFSDCTNGPRMGFISGCYPLDPVYKALPEWEQIKARKKG